MELKNAIAVCLISLFSATLVVMIARSLDSQAASRIEPQLASIVEELRAIRKQGGISVSRSAEAQADALDEGLVVYYFHGDARCPTCEAIESQSHETVLSDFKAQLDRRQMAWKILNYQDPAVSVLTKKFDIQTPVVVLAKMKAGQIQEWKRLDDVWGLVGEKRAFADYLRTEIKKMLGVAGGEVSTKPATKESKKSVPVPANLPLPK
jgi:hypothetical protein